MRGDNPHVVVPAAPDGSAAYAWTTARHVLQLMESTYEFYSDASNV